MPDPRLIAFDPASARRIAAAVKEIERTPRDGTGPRRPRDTNDLVETVWGKLTARGDGETIGELWQYSWTEQQLQEDGTWADKTDGRTGDQDPANDPGAGPAWHPEKSEIDLTNRIVLLRRAQYLETAASSADTDEWKQVWEIVPPLPDGLTFVVTLYDDGNGADGDNVTEPTYTYDVSDLAGNPLGTAMSPEVGRTNGSFDSATKGLGYYGSDRTTFHLLQAFETPNTTTCE